MSSTNSPQAKEMADESMVRNLAAQAEAIWPQEEPIVKRHPIGDGAVLDLGCGTGEITARLAELFPRATFVGADLEEPHLVRARARCAVFGDRVRFEIADAMALPYTGASFDFVVCRHVLQDVPDAAKVLAEITRAIAGVLGAYIVLFPKQRVTTLIPIFIFITVREIPAVFLLGFWIVVQIFFGAVSMNGDLQSAGGVAYFAHIGGFIAGMLLIVLLGGLRRPPLRPVPQDYRWRSRPL